MKLEDAYIDLAAAETDMKCHIPRLRELARGCRVVEFGTRRGVSTVAMLAAHPRELTTYDIMRHSDLDIISDMAKEAGIPFYFVQQDIDKLAAIPRCDFVFIDAMHNGSSVAIHLRLARRAWASVIALHDTVSFARAGDLPGTPGILDAVDGFIAEYPEWQIAQQYFDCYGLTVLRKSV